MEARRADLGTNGDRSLGLGDAKRLNLRVAER